MMGSAIAGAGGAGEGGGAGAGGGAATAAFGFTTDEVAYIRGSGAAAFFFCEGMTVRRDAA